MRRKEKITHREHCGNSVLKGTVVCPYCGQRISTFKKKKQMLSIVFIFILLAYIVFHIGFYIIDRIEEKQDQEPPIVQQTPDSEIDRKPEVDSQTEPKPEIIPEEKPTVEPEEKPVDMQKEYQKIYKTYAAKMRKATPKLLKEFKQEAEGKNLTMQKLARICNEKVGVLADICNDGSFAMADISFLDPNSSYDDYEDWNLKLSDVYMEESMKINDYYIELSMYADFE